MQDGCTLRTSRSEVFFASEEFFLGRGFSGPTDHALMGAGGSSGLVRKLKQWGNFGNDQSNSAMVDDILRGDVDI